MPIAVALQETVTDDGRMGAFHLIIMWIPIMDTQKNTWFIPNCFLNYINN